MQLNWRTSETASALHAASQLSAGRKLVDPRLAAELAAPAAALQQWIAEQGLPAERVWQHLVPLVPLTDSVRQLARGTLLKVTGRGPPPEQQAGELAGHVAELEQAFRRAVPDAAKELPLRIGPIRQLWEARGPGLLFVVGRVTDERVLVERAEAMVVHPACGGGGVAHLTYNTVRWEGVLANPTPQLPEVARLAYLLAQLNVDLPMFSDRVHRDRLAFVAALALVPPVLSAAQEVELANYQPATLALAVEHWALPASPPLAEEGTSAKLADLLNRWWSVHQATRPPWSLALAALDALLREERVI